MIRVMPVGQMQLNRVSVGPILVPINLEVEYIDTVHFEFFLLPLTWYPCGSMSPSRGGRLKAAPGVGCVSDVLRYREVGHLIERPG